MSYAGVNELPESLKKVLPESGQKVFVEIYNDTYTRNPSLAFATAWNAVKTKFREVDGKIVANSKSFEVPKLYTFQLNESDTKFVMNSETDEIILESVLANTDYNTDGHFFDEEALAQINEQINMYGSTLPDVDHETLKAMIKKHGNNVEAIKADMAQSKGVFKKIKSVIKDGKLWIQAFLDKRYKKHMDKFNSLSIEALADRDLSTGRLTNPSYLGFTFTNNPKLKSANIVK